MFNFISQEIKRSGLDNLLAAGVVLTGGTASLNGIRDLAADALHVPVRIGSPQRLQGLVEAVSSPAYATAVGLLLWGAQMQDSLGDDLRFQNTETWWKRLARMIKHVFKLLLPRS
jgi:cell division protein FtsA